MHRDLIQALADVTDAGYHVVDVVRIGIPGRTTNISIRWGEPGAPVERFVSEDELALAGTIRTEMGRRATIDPRALVAVEQIGPSAAPVEAG